MNRILITAIGGDIGSAIARCLRQSERKYYIVGIDVVKFNQGLEYVDEYYLVPRYTEDNYLKAIREICKEESIECIIPTTEKEIQIFDENRDRFQGTHLMINNHNILSICLSKYNTAKYLETLGVNVPKTIRADSVGTIEGFPVVVKADYGNGSKTMRIAYEKNDLENLPEGSIIQEYIGSLEDEYTVGVFSDGAEFRTISFRRKLEMGGGMSIYVELVNDRKIDEIAEIIAKAMKLQGYINLQMRKQNGQYYIFEINPRISGTVGFRHKLGFRDVVWWLDFLEENNLEKYEPASGHHVGVKKYDEIMFKETGKEIKVFFDQKTSLKSLAITDLSK